MHFVVPGEILRATVYAMYVIGSEAERPYGKRELCIQGNLQNHLISQTRIVT